MNTMKAIISDKKISQSNKEGENNPWVIFWVLGLATVVLINAVFIIIAFITSPGLVDENYYEKGREYEQNAMKMLAAHEALKWKVQFNLPDEIVLLTPTHITFSAVDVRGLPIDNAELTLVSFRPSDEDADFTTTMNEYAPGLYDAELNFSLKGIWDLNLTMTRGEDSYQLTQRIYVKPK